MKQFVPSALLGVLLIYVAVPAFPQDRRFAPTSSSGVRYALIIGNNAYPWKPLKNAVNDAKDLAAELPRVGFAPENITLVTDANLLAMQKASIEFLQKLRSDDLAFVFYSGHGVEVRGENYLVPTDFPSDATELDVQYRAFSAQQFLRNLEASAARARIMILDACRDNPLRAARSASGGLARMDGSGTLIVFATGSGRTADDNSAGRNGFFTAHLLKDLPRPGITVDDLMRQVAREVNHDSAGKQTPALYGLLLEDFALVPGTQPEAALSGASRPPHIDATQQAWELVKNSNNPDDFDDFAKQFPNSDLAPLAKLRAGQLKRSQAPSVSPALKRQILPEIMHYCRDNCITLRLKNGYYVSTTRYSWESPDYSSTWVVESFTPSSVILHRTDTGSFALKITITGQISGDTLVDVKEDGMPSKGRLAWGTSLDTVPGSNEERDRRGWHIR